MTHSAGVGPEPAATDNRQPINLVRAGTDLLEVARRSAAGRAGRTLTPGAGAALKQTLLALVGGKALADHESPAAATLQVLTGRVRLTSPDGDADLGEGDFAAIPPVRHGLDAIEDAVVLISVAQPSVSPGAAGD